MRTSTYILSTLAAVAIAAPNPSPVSERDIPTTTTSLTGAQSSAVFAAWYLYAMTLPASNPTILSLVHYVATAVPTTAYTFTPTPLPTSWDLAGYLNSPPAPSFPAWLTAIPDVGARASYSRLIEQLESDSISLGRLATAGIINGTTFPGIVPVTATRGGGDVVSQIGDGQVQAPTGKGPATVTATATATATMTATAVSMSTATVTATRVASVVVSGSGAGTISSSSPASAASSSSPASAAAVEASSASGMTTSSRASVSSATTSVATYTPGKNAAGGVGVSVGAVVVAGVVGLAAVLL